MQTIAIILFLTYLCLLVQVAVHNCVHNSFIPGNKKANLRAGKALSWTQFQSFTAWKAVHLLHHRFTNTPRDPHYVDRPMVPYLLTHYWRVAQTFWTGWGAHLRELAPGITGVALITISQLALGNGLSGLQWAITYWLIPAFLGHLLMAHFNYVGHVNMPEGRGRNTRSFYGGPWKVINKLTFNFYVHAEHHLRASEAVPVPDPGQQYACPMTGPARPPGTHTETVPAPTP